MTDDTYDRVVFQLQILGKIREHDRLYCTQNGLDVCGPSKLDFLYRTWYGETRTSNITNVKEILSTAFALIESLLNKAESYSIATIVDDGESSNSSGSGSGRYLPARHREIEQTKLRQRLDHLQNSLSVARTGLNSWSRTYKHDIKTVQQIENIVKSIDDYMVQIDISRGYIDCDDSRGLPSSRLLQASE